MIDLEDFSDSEKFNIEKPFSGNGYIYATDGAIAIRIDADRCGAYRIYAPGHEKIIAKIDLMIAQADASKMLPLPDYDEPDIDLCSVCEGTGRVADCEPCDATGFILQHDQSDEFGDPIEELCDDCAGTGKVAGNMCKCDECQNGQRLVVPVRFGDTGISYLYLLKLETLPGLRIDLSGNQQHWESIPPINFTFDGGCGVVMPIRI